MEREANRAANRAMAGDTIGSLRTVARAQQHKYSEGEEQILQPKRNRQTSTSETNATRPAIPHSVQDTVRGPGHPLDSATRAYFESRFGHDFSRVRVHSGSEAAESSQAIDAQAYTVDHHIVFGPGQYAPDTANGRRLVAHELAHVVQQSQGAAPIGVPLRKPKEGSTKAKCHSTSRVNMFGNTETLYILDGFATKKAKLTATHLGILDEVADDLKERPLLWGGFVTVFGHADRVPSTDPNNKALGQMRADAVLAALIQRGVPTDAVHAYSLGDKMPAVETEAAEPKNRRVTITVTRRPLPGFFNLKPSQPLGPGLTPPLKSGPGEFDLLRPGPCVVYPPLCRPETPREAGRRIMRPIPAMPAQPEAIDQLARWLTRDIPIPGWLVKTAEAFGVENARKKLREALQKGGRAALEKALKEIIEAVAGPPIGRPPAGPPLSEIPPPPIIWLPEIRF